MTSPFKEILPEEIKPFFFEFDWHPEKVWDLSVEVTTLEREHLDWHLELPFWSSSDDKPLFNIVPQRVLGAPKKYPKHYSRVIEADLSYPIDLMWSVDRLLILDGMHRLARLKHENTSQAMARIIPRSMIPLIRK